MKNVIYYLKSYGRSILGEKSYNINKQHYLNVQRKISYGFHILTTPFQPLPDFLIIGAQKCGTSALYTYLSYHPQLKKSILKEINYFNDKFDKKTNWYKRHFPLLPGLKKDIQTYEATPEYLYHPNVAERIASFSPHIKLILLLRNPVDRAISNYWHNFNSGREKLSMRETFEKEIALINKENKKPSDDKFYNNTRRYSSNLDRGIYSLQIERYLKHFNLNQILILKSEDFFQDPQATLDKTTDFLTIDQFSFSDTKPRGVGKYKTKTDPQIIKELNEFFKPYNKQLYDQIGFDMGW